MVLVSYKKDKQKQTQGQKKKLKVILERSIAPNDTEPV